MKEGFREEGDRVVVAVANNKRLSNLRNLFPQKVFGNRELGELAKDPNVETPKGDFQILDVLEEIKLEMEAGDFKAMMLGVEAYQRRERNPFNQQLRGEINDLVGSAILSGSAKSHLQEVLNRGLIEGADLKSKLDPVSAMFAVLLSEDNPTGVFLNKEMSEPIERLLLKDFFKTTLFAQTVAEVWNEGLAEGDLGDGGWADSLGDQAQNWQQDFVKFYGHPY